MNELKAIATNILLLPEWAKTVALNLLGIYVVLQLVHLILKKLQKPELSSAFSALRNFSGQALRQAGRSLKLPVERPRLALVSLVLNSALFYVYALIFFAWYGVFFMLSATAEELLLIRRLMGFGVAAAFFIASRWYYVSAERQRIAAFERWRSLRRNSDS